MVTSYHDFTKKSGSNLTPSVRLEDNSQSELFTKHYMQISDARTFIYISNVFHTIIPKP